MSQEFALENIDEWTYYFLGKIKQNEWMSTKHKVVCVALNCIKHVFVLASTITGRISISTFASLIGVTIGITSSATGLKICAIDVGIKRYKSIKKKKKKNMIKSSIFSKI